ncbi:PREDICTED: prospero homeobox protein 2-like, partial [Phaethon lepturus]|uniref:prospero homeobox protein 2-like n=1 Tax=Phaethon lepturus TaxID=97097 RepID=UPI00053097D2
MKPRSRHAWLAFVYLPHVFRTKCLMTVHVPEAGPERSGRTEDVLALPLQQPPALGRLPSGCCAPCASASQGASASLMSQLLSHPIVGRSLDPTILFPSAQAVALPQDYECGASPGEGAQALAFPRTRAPAPMPCASERDQLSDQHLRDQLSDQHLQAKRARVESIIQGMSLPPTPQAFGTSLEAAFGHERERGSEMRRESKRKPRVPQQGAGVVKRVAPGRASPHAKGCQQLKEQLCFLEQQLRQLQEKFSQVCDAGDAAQTREGAEKVHSLPGKPGDRLDKDSAAVTSDLCKTPVWRSILEVHGPEEDEDRDETGGLPSATRVLSQALKHELAGVMSRVVDSVLKSVWPKAASHLLQQHHSLPVPGPDARREQMQEALTPGHLKKAKLMFFFTRYPSSTLLKTYFLDVQFSRCITSQLIKWFSNFREFYYIQVEKFARQALLEGVVDASTLWVSRDSELFRALNMHYNKGNDFE